MNVDSRYSEETILKKRKFPKTYTVFLVILVIIQIALIVGGIFYKASPMDRIDNYEVYVTPLDDGTLDIRYRIKWTALDSSEPLTWIQIGMANPNFAIYGGHSSNIDRIVRVKDDDGYTAVKIYLKDSYIDGESFEIEFEINQKNILCEGENKSAFYEFVPSWFNAIPVSYYAFYWRNYGNIMDTNSDGISEAWYKWEGSLEPGEYRLMRVDYSTFNAPTTYYYPFNDSGAYDSLAEEKYGVWAMIFIFLVVTIIAEVYLIDAFVSYNRGRGFLTGYGHHVHTYGYRNPRYIAAHRTHVASSGGRGGRGGGRGCACACACACAGGGRAGCSQKDTTEIKAEK